jgi:replicative DNA helicase
MASVGFGLLNSLISSNVQFSILNNESITEEHFVEREKDAYVFIREFLMDYGTYPKLSTVARHIGELTAFDGLVEEPVNYWVSQIRERKRFNDIRSTMMQMRENIEGGKVDDAIVLMGSSYLALRNSYGSSRMLGLREVQEEVLDKHDILQASPDIPGIPMGFPFLDSITGGNQPGDYSIIVGQTGVGKTYLALRMALSGHVLLGRNVIFVSTEMPTLQAGRRVLALEGNFSTTDLKMGRLSFFGRSKAKEIIENGKLMFNNQEKYFYFLPGGMFSNVEDIAILAKEMRPDLLVVDGAYLLQVKAASWWEKNMEVASILKNLALVEGFPVIATYQYTKKDKGKLEGVGGGFAIPQIASNVYSFEYERKEDVSSGSDVQYRILKLTKGRDGESGAIRVLYDMRRTILQQDRVLTGRIDPDERVAQGDRSSSEDINEVEEI